MKLIQLGIDEDYINKLTRWERVAVLRYKSSKAAELLVLEAALIIGIVGVACVNICGAASGVKEAGPKLCEDFLVGLITEG